MPQGESFLRNSSATLYGGLVLIGYVGRPLNGQGSLKFLQTLQLKKQMPILGNQSFHLNVTPVSSDFNESLPGFIDLSTIVVVVIESLAPRWSKKSSKHCETHLVLAAQEACFTAELSAFKRNCDLPTSSCLLPLRPFMASCMLVAEERIQD